MYSRPAYPWAAFGVARQGTGRENQPSAQLCDENHAEGGISQLVRNRQGRNWSRTEWITQRLSTSLPQLFYLDPAMPFIRFSFYEKTQPQLQQTSLQ